MTNREHLFGTPERAIHTETEFHSWPFFIAVYETSRMSSCTTYAIRALALGLMAMAVAACG